MNKKLKNTLIVMSILIFILLFLIVFYLKRIETNSVIFYEDSQTILTEIEGVTEISQSYYFQDKDLIHIHQGKKNNETFLYFVDVEARKIIDQALVSDLYSEEILRKNLSQSCSSCQLISIQPAYIDGQKLYEVKYKETPVRYVYDYYDLLTGKHIEKLKLSQKFN